MATITSTGIGSGLDVSTIVTGLMSVEKRPLTLLQTQATTYQSEISAFGSLKNQISSLSDIATKLATASNWNPLVVDSSDSSSLSATADTTAQAGSHSVQVDQLAQAQVLASGNFGASTTVVGTGSLKIELGTTAAGVFTPGTADAVTVAIGSGQQTLAGIRDAINAAGAGVTASIVNGTGGARLVLRGAEGAASSVRITATDDDGTPTNSSGLSALAFDPAATAGTGKNLTQTQVAQDARFNIDGVALTSASNSPTGVLDGVTLSFKKVTTAPVSLNVSVQTVAVQKNVNDFVNAFNSLNTLLKSQTQADPTGANNGPLQADSTAVGLLNTLHAMLRGSVAGLSSPDSLNAAGIELQADGSLAVNSTKLTPLLNNPSKLAALFSQAQSGTDVTSRGFGVRFKQWASDLTSDSGSLQSHVAALQQDVTDNQKRQDSMQTRLDATEARLRTQYQQLDTVMSSLNARLAQMKSALGLA